MAAIAGYSEPALRIVPWIASVSALVLLATVLRRLFGPPLACLAFTVAVSNYWVIKYGQQVKQYGTDLLYACLILFLLERVVVHGREATHRYWLVAFGCVSSFLAFPSVFWFPALVLAFALGCSNAGRGLCVNRRSGRAAFGFGVWLATCFLLNYILFIKPNQTPAQFENFAGDFFDLRHPWASLGSLQGSLGALLVPLGSRAGKFAAFLILVMASIGAVRAFVGSLKGDRVAITVFQAGPVPILTSILASAAHLYPVFFYPRFVLWAVPCLVVMIGYGLGPRSSGHVRVSRRACPGCACRLPAPLSVSLPWSLARSSFSRFLGPPKRIVRRWSSYGLARRIRTTYLSMAA